MGFFNFDAIKDMEYDTDRERYVGADGSEFKTTPYSNGTGYKWDYYDQSTYGNAPHNSTHMQVSLDGRYERVDNDRDNDRRYTSSGWF